MYYPEFLELGTGTCRASASSMLREGDWSHVQDTTVMNYNRTLPINHGDIPVTICVQTRTQLFNVFQKDLPIDIVFTLANIMSLCTW